MKKIVLLLAVLLVLGMLAGCNAGEEKKTPDHVVPGYSISLYTGKGWTAAKESQYDLELSKDGVTMFVMGFTTRDFVDMPSAEELFLDCNDDLLEELADVSVKEEETSYEKDGRKIISTLFSGKSGGKTRQYYCFAVDFDDEAESVAWVCFSATERVMKRQKAALKTIVDEMDANGAEELEDVIGDAMGEEELVGDNYVDGEIPAHAVTEDVPEQEETGGETKPAEGTGDTQPVDDKDAPAASTEATETTEAAE